MTRDVLPMGREAPTPISGCQCFRFKNAVISTRWANTGLRGSGDCGETQAVKLCDDSENLSGALRGACQVAMGISPQNSVATVEAKVSAVGYVKVITR